MADTDTTTSDIKELAKKTLLSMGQWRIPLSPENYHVWFEYTAGTNEELAKAIKRVIQTGGSFTADMNLLFYHKYLGKRRDPEVWQQARQEVESILRDILDELLTTSVAASKYGHHLADYSQKLGQAEDLTQMQGLVKDMLRETRAMAESSFRLQKRLQEATDHAEDLKRQLAKAQKDAETDPLTGLANRKAVSKRLEGLFDEFRAEGRPFSVIMLDIDYFKAFNDAHGHAVGDAVLRKVAAILNDNIKGMDLPGRFGGEEFILVLPRTKLADAFSLAEQIRETLAKQRHRLVQTDQDIGTINVSCGVAQVRSADTPESIVERADSALYLAKKSGRNNVKSEQDLATSQAAV